MSARSALRGARALGLAGALAGAAAAGPAAAQPNDADKSAAQALFEEARRLTGAQRWADACPMLAESQRLDPSMGTQFYLAECLEQTGRITAAWTHYLEVADAARAAGQEDRERYTRARAEALRQRLPRLVVNVPTRAARAAGFQVRRDGVPLGGAQWGAAIPVDPGEHVIAASARGKKPWTTTVHARETEELAVAVPALEDDDAGAAPPAPLADAAPARAAGTRLAAIVAGAVGVVGLGVGAGFGVAAIARKNESNSGGHCDAADTCDPIGTGLRRDSLRAATASTIAFVAGGAAIAGGVVLLLVAPRGDEAPSARATVAVRLGLGSLSLSGRW